MFEVDEEVRLRALAGLLDEPETTGLARLGHGVW